MQVKINELQEGDEILVPINSNLAKVKLLRTPSLSKKQPSWRPAGTQWYKSVKCLVSMKETTYTYHNGYTYTRKEYSTSDEFNVEKRLSLNQRDIWLIKKYNS